MASASPKLLSGATPSKKSITMARVSSKNRLRCLGPLRHSLSTHLGSWLAPSDKTVRSRHDLKASIGERARAPLFKSKSCILLVNKAVCLEAAAVALNRRRLL